MLETSARLLRLLSLLQARRFWTGPELAEHMEVTVRTVRRDVDRLRELGYPIDAAAGVAGGYRLGAGAALPPLLLEDDEALAIVLGLRSAAAGSVSGMEEATVRALGKLEQVLPARLRRRMKNLHSAVVPLPWSGPSVDAGWLTIIAGACRDRERLTFRYGDRKARDSDRDIEPHGLVHAGRRWYLVGWDLGRTDFRTFRVDRLQSEPVPGKRFTPRAIPGGDLAAYVSRSVSTLAYQFAARVIVHAPRARVAERVPLLAAHIEAIDAQRCVLETGENHLGRLAIHIAQIGYDFEVLEPPELIEQLRALGKRFARATRHAARPR
jgi:predicted DNA-binding transcriptional regulator YafY